MSSVSLVGSLKREDITAKDLDILVCFKKLKRDEYEKYITNIQLVLQPMFKLTVQVYNHKTYLQIFFNVNNQATKYPVGRKFQIDIWISPELNRVNYEFFLTGPKYFQIMMALEYKKLDMKIN